MWPWVWVTAWKGVDGSEERKDKSTNERKHVCMTGLLNPMSLTSHSRFAILPVAYQGNGTVHQVEFSLFCLCEFLGASIEHLQWGAPENKCGNPLPYHAPVNSTELEVLCRTRNNYKQESLSRLDILLVCWKWRVLLWCTHCVSPISVILTPDICTW